MSQSEEPGVKRIKLEPPDALDDSKTPSNSHSIAHEPGNSSDSADSKSTLVLNIKVEPSVLQPGIEEQDTLSTSNHEDVSPQADSDNLNADDQDQSNVTTNIPKPKNAPMVEDKGYEESLRCSLCLEIFHNAICLHPCGHFFCSGCYSQWMLTSKSCPQCRSKVQFLSKNRIFNDIVLSYLSNHPDKLRNDLNILDSRNKINKDFVKVSEIEDFGGTASEGDEEEDDSDDDSSGPTFIHLSFDMNLGAANSSASTSRTVLSCCCHEPNQGKTTVKNEPGTKNIRCCCCDSVMPDKRVDFLNDPSLPSQECASCNKIYCHLYYSCTKAECKMCFNKMKDFKFEGYELGNAISNNCVETKILQDFLLSKNRSWLAVLRECVRILDLHPTNSRHLNSDSAVCRDCAQIVFKSLIYEYRQNIPRDELPFDVINKPDCYYGRNCRTQTHKYSHAKKYNHICEQKRF